MDKNRNNYNLVNVFKDSFETGKENTFTIYQRFDGTRECYSFSDILSESNYLLSKMEKCGLKKGDRVGIVASLRPWWFALAYACLRGGYIMTCIDPGVPVIQMQKMMLETEIRACFTTLKTIHLPEELDGSIPVFSISSGFPLMSKCEKVSYYLGDSTPLPEDTDFILFSSGTTGENRKAVLLSERTVSRAMDFSLSNETGVYKNNPIFSPNKRDLMLFPPYHIAGWCAIANDLRCNSEIIILERLTPNGLSSAMQELKPDNICTVPSMLNSLYKKIVSSYTKKASTRIPVNFLLSISGLLRRRFGIRAGRTLLSSVNNQAFGGNIKSFVIGASPFDATANKFFLDMGIDVVMSYGLTELGAPLTTTGQGYYPGTAGRILKNAEGFDLRIINKDETGKGEVEIKSPYRMISYINEEDNAGCFTEDGYFKTGDLGYFDENDCLNICGRVKECIVLRNGEKLLPEEIESKYQNLDAIKDIAVFKVPGEGGCDDFAMAIIKDRSKGIPDEATKVRVYERSDKLPSMYRPKDVYIVKEFPLSSSHKIQRFRLTEMAINGQNDPVTDATMIPIDEDETTKELRKILVDIGGPQWKTQQLTQGLLLNIDSLSMVNLYVAIQDKWEIDLFQSSIQPETFGELLDVVNNYKYVDKKEKKELDLSKYPLPSSSINNIAMRGLEKVAKLAYRVKYSGTENFPKDTNFLICSNHVSDIDPAFLSSVIPPEIMKNTCIVGKAELVQDKLFKNIVISRNIIPVDRTGNSIKTLDRCQELLLEGWNILIFPEGTSVQNHKKLFPLKEGSARLAIATQKPIVPTLITGIAHNDREMNKFMLPSLKSQVNIKFGKPFYPAKDATPQEINEILTRKIEELN